MTQLDLLSSVEPYSEPRGVNGRQHAQVLLALYEASERGLTGEECAVRLRFRANHIATTRLGELCDDRDRFPVPLVYRTERKRPCASGRNATVFALTSEGKRAAARLTEGDV